MGVLDDAIREHLELKRRHGADENELSVQEKEALGPARREQPAEPEPEGEPEAELEPAYEDEYEEEYEEPPQEEPPQEEPIQEEALPEEPLSERRRGETPTRGFPAIDEPPAEAEEGEEDVLEETPEFLQETPEHDRLWFEQKPPREFDFDDDRE